MAVQARLLAGQGVQQGSALAEVHSPGGAQIKLRVLRRVRVSRHSTLWAGVGASRFTGPVAIKVPHADSIAFQAVAREAWVLSRLRHAGIPTLIGHGRVTGDVEGEFGLRSGMACLASRFGGACQLFDRLGTLDWPTLKRYLLGAAVSLQHVHDVGFLHCDIKPSNLLVNQNRGRIMIVDFGSAMVLRDKVAADGGIESADGGIPLGSPAYMAPEHFLRDSSSIGPWSDLYSLGCTAYALATSSMPFGGKSYMALRQEHLFDPPPLDRLRAEFSGEFTDWVSWLLAKEASARPQSAIEAAHALETIGRETVS